MPILPFVEKSKDILVVGGLNGYTTINEALRVASSETTIRVMVGVYRESLVLNKDVTIIGVGNHEQIVIIGSGKSAILSTAKRARVQNVTLKQEDNNCPCVDISSGGILIEGCDISGGKNCIAIHGESAPIIRSNQIHEAKQQKDDSKTGHGIYLYKNAKGTIKRNAIFNNENGIFISSTAMVRKNKIYKNKLNGIAIFGKGRFEGNDIFKNENNGIFVFSMANPIVQKNWIHENKWNGITIFGKGRFKGNDIFKNEKHGIFADSKAEPAVRNNQLYENKASGIWIQGNGIIKANDIFKNERFGIIVGPNNDLDIIMLCPNKKFGGYLIFMNGLSDIEINSIYAPMVRINRIYENKASGIWIQGNGIIEANDIFKNENNGVFVNSNAAPMIRKNRIHENEENGILNHGNGIIEENDILKNENNGVYVHSDHNFMMRNNQIYENKESGIWIQGKGTFEKNSIFKNKFGISVGSIGDPVVSKNQIYKNKASGIWIQGKGTFKENNIFNNEEFGIIVGLNNGLDTIMLCTNKNFHGFIIFMDGLSDIETNLIGDPMVCNNRIHKNRKGGIAISGKGRFEENKVFKNKEFGVFVNSNADPMICRNKIYENEENGILNYGNGIIKSNEIFKNERHGVYVDSDHNFVIRNNQIYENKVSGIWIQGKGTFEENDIFKNNFGIVVSSKAAPVIRKNQIHENKKHGIYIYGRGRFEENDIFKNEQTGINVYSNAVSVVHKNRIYENRWSGIQIDGKGRFEENDIFKNKVSGIFVDPDSDPVVRKNRIHENGVSGIDIYGKGRFEENNIFKNEFYGIYTNENADPVVRNNQLYKNNYKQFTEKKDNVVLAEKLKDILVVGGINGYKTINEALRFASPETTIRVMAGIYRESFVISKNVAIVGVGKREKIVIIGSLESVISSTAKQARIQNVTFKQENDNYPCVDILSGGILIEECDISGGNNCIAIHGQSAPMIRNNWIHNAKHRIYDLITGHGIFIYEHAKGTIEGNEIFKNSTGVYVTSNAEPVMRNNRIHENKKSGIKIDGQVRFEGNEIFKNSTGVYVTSKAAPMMCKNRIYENEDGIYINGKGMFEGNEIFKNEIYGIYVDFTGAPVVRKNRIYENGSYGIGIFGDGRFEGNKVFKNEKTDIYVDSNAAPVVRNNQLHDNNDKQLSEKKENVVLAGKSKDVLVVGGLNGYKTINEALREASPETTIRVMPGIYRESFVISKNVAIVGVGKREKIVIIGSLESVISSTAKQARIQHVTLKQEDDNYPCVDISSGGILIEGCDISGGNNCIAIYGQSDPLIRNNRIYKAKHRKYNLITGHGIYLYEIAKGTIEGNEIFSHSTGVYVTLKAAPVMRKNRIHENKNGGIQIDGKGRFEANEIFKNSTGVYVTSKAAPVMRKNRIRENVYYGIKIFGEGRFEANEIFKNEKTGIYVDFTGAPVVRKNRIHENGHNGIEVFGDGIFEENEVFKNEKHNIHVDSNVAPVVRNNQLHDNNDKQLTEKKENVVLVEKSKDVLIVGGLNGYTTINEALRVASPETTIRVMPGIYRESLVLDKNVTIIGVGKVEDIVIVGAGKSAILSTAKQARIQNVTLQQEDGDNSCVDISTGGILIEGCDISGGNNCIVIHGQSDPMIRNNRIHKAKSKKYNYIIGRGIYLYGNAKGTIEGNEIFKNSTGVYVTSKAAPVVRKNRIHENKKGGIQIDGKGTFEENEIFKNELGIFVSSNAAPMVCKNQINENEDGIYISGKGTFEENDIFKNEKHGLYVDSTGDPVVYKNQIYENIEYEIFIEESSQRVNYFGKNSVYKNIEDNIKKTINQTFRIIVFIVSFLLLFILFLFVK